MAQVPAIVRVRQSLDRMEPEFRVALPSHIKVDQFKRVAQTAIMQSPDLQTADPRMLMAACVKAAQDGLLPDGREGAIVMFKGKPQWMPMVYGILMKMRQSEDVKSVTARCVYANDTFTYVMGDEEKLEHIPCLDDDPGQIRLVYAIAHLANGEIVREVLTKKQIDKRKASSASGDRGPWGSWYDEMARKSAVRALAKYLPQSAEIEKAMNTVDANLDLPEHSALPASAPAHASPALAAPDAFERASVGVTDVPAEVPDQPTSPIGLSGKLAEATWPVWTNWLRLAVMATPGAERQALVDAHPKEWAEMQKLRAPEAEEIRALLADG